MHDRFVIFTVLDQEWRHFSASGQASVALARWRKVEPALATLDTVDDVLSLRRDPQRANEVLGMLVSRSGRDRVAARVVLQALMPGLVRLAVLYGRADPETTAGDLVAIAWVRICSYPTQRIGSVAANLLFDIRKQLLAEREPMGDLPASDAVVSAEDTVIDGLFVEELAHAEATGVIAEGAADLIMQTRVDGHPVVELATRRGVSAHGLVQRRLRAEKRLRDHLEVA